MDQLAEIVRKHYAHPGGHLSLPPSTSIAGEGWQLWQGSHKIIDPSSEALYSIMQASPSQMWWKRHGQLTQEACDNIDWRGTKDMMRSLNPSEWRFVMKHALSNCGVGTTLGQWNLQQDNACPRCSKPETPSHVYQCSGHNATDTWDANMSQLDTYLRNSQTDPQIRKALTLSLSSWWQSSPIPIHQIAPPLQYVIYQQQAIGWSALLEGGAGTQWHNAQQDYCLRHWVVQSNRRWMRNTLIHLVCLGRGQWLHRNNEKHTVLQPRHHRADACLQRAII